MVKYADDLVLSIPIYLSVNHVMEEINNIRQWSLSKGLELNDRKCKYMLFSRSTDCNPVHIPHFVFCTRMKLLGVHFSNDFKWDFHFNTTSVTANRRAFAFRVLKPLFSINELVTLYKSIVLSILEYCSPLFVGITSKNQAILQSIQHRFHNIICFYNCQCDKFPNLYDRRVLAATKLFMAAHSDDQHVLNCIIPLKRTFFAQPYCRTTTYQTSFVPFITEIINSTIDRGSI